MTPLNTGLALLITIIYSWVLIKCDISDLSKKVFSEVFGFCIFYYIKF